MQPKMKRYENIYRGPSSSEEYNDLRDALYADLITLYGVATNHDIRIMKNFDTIMLKNYYLQNKINELETILEDVELSVDNGTNARFLTKRYCNANNTIYNLETYEEFEEGTRLTVDNFNQTLGLSPVTRESRIYTTDANLNNFMPDNTGAGLFEQTSLEAVLEDTTRINDREIYNALDGNRFTYWTHITKKESSVDTIYAKIEIFLPVPNNYSSKVNEIVLHPCPEYSQSIIGLQYRDAEGAWVNIETYPEVNGVQQEIPFMRRMKFIFSTVDIQELRILIKQSNYITNGSFREFTYGFQSIETLYNEYPSLPGSIITEFSLENTDKYFKKIRKAESKKSLGSIDAVENISYKFYYKYNSDQSIGLGTFGVNIPALDCKKIYLVTQIERKNDITPLLDSTTIEYENY